MRWTRARYERAAELGLLADQRVELIGGQIVEMASKSPRHSVANEFVRRALERVFPRAQFTVWTHVPLALSPYDEPEPDAAVVVGRPDDYFDDHPTAEQTLLVVEVSDTTLAYDRGDKADVYAAAGIDDYWIVNLVERVIEVGRRPAPNPASMTEWRYVEWRRVAPGETIAPLAAPDRPIPAADLLP